MTSWTFITNYGVVLAVIAQHGRIGISKLFCRAASGSSPLEAGDWSRRSGRTRGWGRRCEGWR